MAFPFRSFGADSVTEEAEYESQDPLRDIPAWGISLVLHLSLLLAMALVALPQPVAHGLGDARITLTVPVRTEFGEERYFDEVELADLVVNIAATPSTPPAANPVSQPEGGGNPHAAGGRAADPVNELSALLPVTKPGSEAGFGDNVETAQPLSKFRGAGKQITTDGKAEADLIAREREMYRAREPVGPTAKVSVFGSPAAEGRTFTFVLDRSASTGGDGLDVLDVAAKQLSLAVAYLEPTHRFQIVAYNQRPHYLGPRQMTPATQENKKLVAKFFETVNPYGGTDHALALRAALGAKPDVIFLMTDGGDPFLTPGEYIEIVELARKQTTIHCIQFGQGPALAEGESFMKKLSGASGGSYTYVDVTK